MLAWNATSITAPQQQGTKEEVNFKLTNTAGAIDDSCFCKGVPEAGCTRDINHSASDAMKAE
jgi:hypothetical protein